MDEDIQVEKENINTFDNDVGNLVKLILCRKFLINT